MTLGSRGVLAIAALFVLSAFVSIATWPTIVAAAMLGLVGIVVRIARWPGPSLAAAFAETRSGS